MLNCKRDYIKQPPRIFIAVGHGGPDPGSVHGALREADCNLAMAMQLRADLMRHGVQVKLSRYGDEEDRLQGEIAECNQYAPDFALALAEAAAAGVRLCAMDCLVTAEQTVADAPVPVILDDLEE